MELQNNIVYYWEKYLIVGLFCIFVTGIHFPKSYGGGMYLALDETVPRRNSDLVTKSPHNFNNNRNIGLSHTPIESPRKRTVAHHGL